MEHLIRSPIRNAEIAETQRFAEKIYHEDKVTVGWVKRAPRLAPTHQSYEDEVINVTRGADGSARASLT